MQDGRKAVWSILYVTVAFFPSLKHNFIAYRSSKVSSRPDCIFEIHQLWQSGFSRVYSNCCCSYSFEPEIIKIGQSSHKIYSNNILNFSRVYDNFKCHTKKSENLLKAPRKWSQVRLKNSPTTYSFTKHIYLIYIHKKDLALNNLQGLIWCKTQPTNQTPRLYIYMCVCVCVCVLGYDLYVYNLVLLTHRFDDV